MAEFNEELEDTQAEFQQLDDKMARVSGVATRVGDRLQVCSLLVGLFRHFALGRLKPEMRLLGQIWSEDGTGIESSHSTGDVQISAKDCNHVEAGTLASSVLPACGCHLCCFSGYMAVIPCNLACEL